MRSTEIIDPSFIEGLVTRNRDSDERSLLYIFDKAIALDGLTLEEAALLLKVNRPAMLDALFSAAGKVKHSIYGDRLVLFAPLYISNYCVNECSYCGFNSKGATNKKMLSKEEIKAETEALIEMGHRRVLVECGEDPAVSPIDFVIEAIEGIYSVRTDKGGIRRVNVNIAATGVEDYRRLKQAGIGTYQLFQETYHPESFGRFHYGPKADYLRQITAMDRAMEAGMEDVGLGVLFGLYHYSFEVLSLISHARYLEKEFGVGPHTISVPRFRPSPGVPFSPPTPVSDVELLKSIAVLRLALPYTGMILSTREAPALRAKAFEIGISQASTASAASPGGYGKKEQDSPSSEQFSLSDRRSVEEFINDAVVDGLLPSFCTACYRRGRTGEAFMELARPGDIEGFCTPNAILTFKEYLEDHASGELKSLGEGLIVREMASISEPRVREETVRRTRLIEGGKRDLFF